MDDRERFAVARRRLKAMVDDPFGGQVLRDLVPRGKRITVALASETCEMAIRRAAGDSGGLPAFLAVDVEGSDTPTLLIIDRVGDGVVGVRRPGDWPVSTSLSVDPGDTVATLIAMLRAAYPDTMP